MNEELDILAAEFVLGTLEPAEQRAVERRLGEDPDLAERIDIWTQRLSPLLLSVPPETPRPEVWDSIQAALGQAALAQRIEAVSAMPQRSATISTPSTVPLFERLAFWRWCTLGASAVAAGLALFIAFGTQLLPQDQSLRYVATLNQDGRDPEWLVTVDLATQQLTIRPVADQSARTRPEDRALELWLVSGEGGPAPQSLGLLAPSSDTSLILPAAVRPAETPILAISLEPPGGSPTGLPTGPVVYSGKILAAPDTPPDQ